MAEIRFTQSTRKHRVGRAPARFVMSHCEPVLVTPASDTEPERRTWIGDDDRGRELEIVAVVLPEYVLVIHVMPTALRQRGGDKQ